MAHPAARFDSDAGASHAALPVQRVALTVVIPTLNAASRLPDALQSVWFADEVIVIDAGSRDDTVAVARAHDARVLVVSQTTIGEQRNAGIAVARNAWILALDTD